MSVSNRRRLADLLQFRSHRFRWSVGLIVAGELLCLLGLLVSHLVAACGAGILLVGLTLLWDHWAGDTK